MKKTYRKRSGVSSRRLAIESLESRTVLSGTPIQVDTFDDVVAADSQTSLREAIEEAATKPGDDVILLPAGNYDLDNGQLVINDSSGKVTIQSGGAAVNAQGNGRVFFIDVGSDVEIKGLTITGGKLDTFGGGRTFYGGGIFSSGASLTLKNSHVMGNVAIEGGGIHCENGSRLTLKNSTVTDNIARDELPFDPAAFPTGNGGGISSENSTVAVVNSEINSNVAVRLGGNGNGGYGGGIISAGFFGSHSLSLKNSEVSGNSINGGGGGIAMFSLGEVTGTLTLQNSLVSHNSTAAEEPTNVAVGGGIWTDSIFGGVNYAMLDNTRIVGNQAGTSGGGIWTGAFDPFTSQDTNDVITLRNSRVTKNEAGIDGGGIWNGGTLILENSRVTRNVAGNNGGGIFNTEDARFAKDKHSKIEDNSDDDVFPV